jgi:hypothetical protein
MEIHCYELFLSKPLDKAGDGTTATAKPLQPRISKHTVMTVASIVVDQVLLYMHSAHAHTDERVAVLLSAKK